MEIGGADRWLNWTVCDATVDFIKRWFRALWPEAIFQWEKGPTSCSSFGDLFVFKDQATVDLEDQVGVTDEVGQNLVYVQFDHDGMNITYMHNDPKWDALIEELVTSIQANRGLV